VTQCGLKNKIKVPKNFVGIFFVGKNVVRKKCIFIVSIFRSLVMKMIYKDIYNIIDSSMSDSQIGSRKAKNIRNHVWVLNSIISDTLSTKKKRPIDIQIYDYKQCFDSLWLEECLNDMYSGGLKDDKFNLLHEANKSVDITVRQSLEILKTLLDQCYVVNKWTCLEKNAWKT
jgi:hypothetical protein